MFFFLSTHGEKQAAVESLKLHRTCPFIEQKNAVQVQDESDKRISKLNGMDSTCDDGEGTSDRQFPNVNVDLSFLDSSLCGSTRISASIGAFATVSSS